ncbi:hypothetical protein [Deinococcus phoenicis]|uniref:hypothetical protein n=1 Tax=Deinococcus phoenicis TaxID=1476583 RepID=UPI0005517C5D|nr:hypothetical protein [Deinococcus phoenicis]
MKNLALGLVAPVLLLSACGQVGVNNRVDIGISTNDATSQVTVTKTVTAPVVDEKGNVTKPGSTTFSSGASGPVRFIFTARPGSDAAYITGYRITRYIINGTDVTGKEVVEQKKMNLYVGSGFTCAERTATDSCSANGTNLAPANGLPSAEVAIDFASALIPVAQQIEGPAYSTVDLEFVGKSSNGASVVIPVSGIGSNAYFNLVNN